MSKLNLVAIVASAICFVGSPLVDGVNRTAMGMVQDPFGGVGSDDPFGGDPFGGDSADVFSGDSPTRPATAGGEQEVLTTDPVALSFLNQEFDSAEKRVIAVITVMNLDEPKAADRLLAGLGAPLKDQAALDFVRSIGTPNILRLTLDEDFPAERKDWFDQTLANAMTFAKSDAHVEESIETLVSGEAEDFQQAYQQLQVAGLDSASSLLGRIQLLLSEGNLENPALRRLVVAVQQGSKSWDLALRSIATQDSEFGEAAILCLAARRQDPNNAGVILGRDPAETPEVLGPVLSNWAKQFEIEHGFPITDKLTLGIWIRQQMQQQSAYIKDLASYQGVLPVWEKEVWLWEPQVSEFTAVIPNRFEAPARNLAIWSTALVNNLPGDKSAQDEYIVAQLQLAKVVRGLDLQLEPDAVQLVEQFTDADRLHRLLKDALASDQTIAAQAILEAMASIGDQDQLQMKGKRYATIVSALSNRDPRVRFAAAETILAWQPTTRFAGSSYFNSALAELLGSTIGSQVIVCSTNDSEAGFLNALARNNGWESEVAQSTSDLFKLIEQQPVSMLILTDSMGDEPFVSVIDRIRELPKGANLPIALLVHGDRIETAKQMFRSDRIDRNLVIASIDGPSKATGKFLAEASQLADRIDLPQAVKRRKTYDALVALGRWVQTKEGRKNLDLNQIAPVVRQLLMIPQLTALAAPIVGIHGNSLSQKQLVVLAGNVMLGAEARSAAATSFRTSVKRFGILLTTEEISEQYARQNRSANESEFSQAILNSLLDTIEARSKTVAFDQLPAIPVQ